MPIEDKKIWVPFEVSGVRAKVPAGLTMRVAAPYCPQHPETKLICPKCVGSGGGKATAEKHADKQSAWGKKGGRPKKVTAPAT